MLTPILFAYVLGVDEGADPAAPLRLGDYVASEGRLARRTVGDHPWSHQIDRWSRADFALRSDISEHASTVCHV
jgi:hypothetical protein